MKKVEWMGRRAVDRDLTREQLSWEFAELFHDLSVEHVDEILAKNVPIETLRFATDFGDDFAEVHGLETLFRHQLPNLFLMGYLFRSLEEKPVVNDEGCVYCGRRFFLRNGSI